MMENSIGILLLLSWLYILQGMPYGIQDKFIPMHLYMQNFNFADISLMKILFLPWVCKGLWAPFIQVYMGPFFWLVASITGLGILSLIGSFLSPTDSIGVAVILFILNLLSAIQDIVVDGLALCSLPDSRIGLANSIQVVMYKVGGLFGGAGLIYLANYTSWRVSFLCISSLYFISISVIILYRYFPHTKCNQKKGSKDNSNVYLFERAQSSSLRNERHFINTEKKLLHDTSKSKITEVYDIIKDVLNTKGMLTLVIYVVIYKMGERGALNNFPLYLLRQGVSTNDLAFWNGVLGQGFSIFGSVVGGWELSNSINQNMNIQTNFLKSNIVKRSFCIFLFYLVVMFNAPFSYDSNESADKAYLFSNSVLYYASMLALVYLNYISGVISTLTFSLMMHQSRVLSKESRATHYSFLASLEVAGKLCFAASAGFIIDKFGLGFSFGLFTLLSFLSSFVL